MTANDAAALRLNRLIIEDKPGTMYWTGILHVLHLLGFIQRQFPTTTNQYQLGLLISALGYIANDEYEEKTGIDGKITYTFSHNNYLEEGSIKMDDILLVFPTVLNDCYMWSICKEQFHEKSIWKDYESFKFEQLFGVKLDGQ